MPFKVIMNCEHCSNLRPPELQNIPPGARVLKLIKVETLRNSQCQECRLIWKAVQPQILEFNDEHFVEVLIARDGPLRVKYTYAAQFVSIELFTREPSTVEQGDSKSNAPYIGSVSEVSEYSGSDACLSVAASWLKECRENHPSCDLESNLPLPTRVIDVGRGNSREPFLLETKGLTPEPYVALSYCWGYWEQHPPMKTVKKDVKALGLKANYEAHKKAIKHADMPSTIQDAVTICRRLGIRYLWVDALCIIQHDPEEWERECGKMCPTYSNATLTISATHADGCTRGIFGRQQHGCQTRYVGELADGRKIYERPNIANTHNARDPGLLSSSEFASNGPVREPLACRAWCMQESVLSNRLLHYTASELVWECNTHHRCECGFSSGPVDLDENRNVLLRRPEMISTSINRTTLFWRFMWSQWLHIFTRRQITNADDKLPALSGLAMKFADVLSHCSNERPNYLAGLWDGDMLPRGLCWYVSIEGFSWSTMGGGSSREYRPKRAVPERAPMWSFMSVDAPIELHMTFGFESKIHVEDARTEPRNRKADPFGNIRSGRILLRGPIRRDLEVEYTGRDFHLDPLEQQQDRITFHLVDGQGNTLEFLPDVPSEICPGRSSGYCLLFVGNSVIGLTQKEPNFLVLRPAKDNQGTVLNKCFKRVGLANMRALPSFGLLGNLESNWAENEERIWGGDMEDITLI